MSHLLEPGSQFAGHRVEELVARGGMGLIYRATQLRPERPVALKLVAPERAGDLATRERLRREADAAASIDHPNVIPIYQAGEEQGLVFIAMRWVDGADLRQVIAREAPLEPLRAAKLVEQIAAALDAAHERGLLHRDVKPPNVLLTAEQHVYLADFGLTRRESSDGGLTGTGRWIGTLDYVAPEQVQGLETSAAGDIYSLGCLLFELLTGRPPFARNSDAATLWAHVHAPVPAASEISPQVGERLDEVLREAMAKSPGARFASAGELARAALRAAVAVGPAPRPGGRGETRDSTAGGAVRPGMPPALSRPGRTPFVARTRQLEHLLKRWERTKSGERAVVLVGGEPGAGKTRIAAELCRSAWEDGARVLYGRCDQDALIAFQPFAEALDHYAAAAPLEELRRLVEGRQTLARLVPRLSHRLPHFGGASRPDSDAERLVLFEACSSFLADLSAIAPVVLVLDDLHWADQATLLLLKFLARGHPFPMLVIGTYRDTEPEASERFAAAIADLRRDQLLERMDLPGMDAAGVGMLVSAWAGEEAPAEFAAALHGETDGNPFFVEEVLRHLSESGAISVSEHRWLSEVRAEQIGIPDQVKDAISQRLTRLDESTRRVLSTAAVIGRRFDLQTLEQLVELPREGILESLDDALHAEVIVELPETIGAYGFSHALVRETLHDSFGATRRAHLHKRIGTVLETLHAEPRETLLASLAYHFFEARHVGEAARAIAYSRRAGEAAMQTLGYEEAARHFERALAVAELEDPGAAARCDLLLALADALEKAGEAPRSRERFRAAAAIAGELGDGERLAAAALGCAGRAWQVFGAADAAAVELLEQALAALPEHDSAARAMVLGSLAKARYFDQPPRSVRALTHEAVEMARRAGDPAALCATLDARHLALWRPSHLAERLTVARELVAVAGEAGAREFELLGRTWLITDLLEFGDLAAVDAEMDRHETLADSIRQPYFRWLARCHATMRVLLSGRLDEAEQLAQETWEIGQRSSDADAVQSYGVHMFILRDDQGRIDELVQPLETFAEQYPDVQAWRAGLMYVYACVGREEDARAALETFARDDFNGMDDDYTYLISMRLLSHVCSVLGDGDRAGLLYSRLIAFDDGRLIVNGPGIGCFGAVSHCLALLAGTAGMGEAAESHFQDALETYRRLGASTWSARAERDRERVIGNLRSAGKLP